MYYFKRALVRWITLPLRIAHNTCRPTKSAPLKAVHIYILHVCISTFYMYVYCISFIDLSFKVVDMMSIRMYRIRGCTQPASDVTVTISWKSYYFYLKYLTNHKSLLTSLIVWFWKSFSFFHLLILCNTSLVSPPRTRIGFEIWLQWKHCRHLPGRAFNLDLTNFAS